MFSSVYQKIVMYLIYRLFPDTFTDSERIFMIQDITPHHLYNEFTPRSPQNGDLIFAFRDRKLLADLSANTCRFPLWENVSSQFPTTTSLIWLFALDQTSCDGCGSGLSGNLYFPLSSGNPRSRAQASYFCCNDGFSSV